MFGKEQAQLRALLAQAQDILQRERWIVGYKHIMLCSNYNLEGEIVTTWALVTGADFLFDLPDYDAVKGWLEIKGFEPYLTGQFEPDINGVDDPVLCDLAFYAIPNKVWRTKRIVSVVDE